MTLWGGVILASLLVYSWKLIGAYVPQRWLEHPMVARIASLLT
ncbi:MAG: hypothetical protein RLZZ443_567, partial [Actinomycetota bacterium]